MKKLKAQCDDPNASQELAWPASVTVTEMERMQAISQLRAAPDGLRNARRELETAKGEYRQMLTVALAALGDKDAVAASANLMLNAEKPAVRVVAASELARLKDKTLIEPFKLAMKDGFKRKRGGCLGPDELIYPVRMFASDALVTLGMSLKEVQKIGYWWDFP